MSSLQVSTHPTLIITSKIPSHYIRRQKINFSSHTNFSTQTISRTNIMTSISVNHHPSIRSCLASSNHDNVGATELPEGLEAELIPKHVAVIMDGNRRWARNRKLPVQLGHRAGGKAMTQMAKDCSKLGVKVLTVFAFSTENWTRSEEEVDFLMSLFEEVLRKDFNELIRHDMQVSVIGDKSRLRPSLQSLIASAEESSKANKGMRFLIALNYGGRYDITEASKKIATKVRDGVLQVEEINEAIFEQHLGTNGIEFPNPDLLIRTSGEVRMSNFMMWQLAYSELYFANELFPDFDKDDLVEALRVFQKRYGRGIYLIE